MIESSTNTIYKIITAALWADAKASGTVPGMPIDVTDGYMHFSTKDQLFETLGLHFKGQGDLVVLDVDIAGIKDDIKWEPSRGGALFPHLYGVLPISAVRQVRGAEVNDQGIAKLSELL